MSKTRLEAFSDGVIAILITIMVLELQVPHGDDLAALRPLVPIFLTYVLSFVMLGIYWNNHHHMLHVMERCTGGILWANLHLLFWLSLIPFVTGWMGENHSAAMPTAAYGVVGSAVRLPTRFCRPRSSRPRDPQSKLAAAVQGDLKGKASLVMYIAAIALAFVNQWLSDALYVSVALMWLVPDPRIEKRLGTR